MEVSVSNINNVNAGQVFNIIEQDKNENISSINLLSPSSSNDCSQNATQVIIKLIIFIKLFQCILYLLIFFTDDCE